MPLINSLENKLGHLAIPHLVRILAVFQLVVWVMIRMQPEFADFIALNKQEVLNGQVWRLITWVFNPGTTSAIWILFAILIMFTMGDALEGAWGAFRVNLYVLGGMLSLDFGTMIFGFDLQGLSLYTTIFLAFAIFVPDYEFYLFFILPVKVKYLAWITGALLLLGFIDGPNPKRLAIAFSLVNFAVAFGPNLIRGVKQKAIVSDRRGRFNASKPPEGSYFHKCQACGKTELDDPKLDFRVTADGEEYCTVCRPKNQPKSDT